MKLLKFRMTILVAALLIFQGITIAMTWQSSRVRVEPLAQSLNNLPEEIDGWNGITIESDPNLIRAIDADELLNRQYSKKVEWPIGIHLAAFNSLEHWCPHSPLECYPGAGWKPQRDTIIRDETTMQNEMHWIEFEKDRSTVQVLYWYQRGDDVYYDRDGARTSRQRVWGSDKCAPLVKVILQTDGRAGDHGKENLLALAKTLQEWIAQDGAVKVASNGNSLTQSPLIRREKLCLLSMPLGIVKPFDNPPESIWQLPISLRGFELWRGTCR